MVDVTLEGSSARVFLMESGPESGPRLLVLHGWGASIEQMKPLMDGLSGHFRVAAVDFPGHGRSPVPEKAYGMEGHLDIIDAIVAHLGWSAFGIVGHSNGGRAALTWAATRAESVSLSFMTLIAPSGIRRQRGASWYAKTWTARTLKAPFRLLPGRIQESGLDWLRHSLLWRVLGSSDYRTLEGVMRETFVRTVNHYVTSLLPRIKVPVLVVRGENDDAISDQQVRTLVDALPDGGLYTVTGAGHYAQLDRPDIVVASILSMAKA